MGGPRGQSIPDFTTCTLPYLRIHRNLDCRATRNHLDETSGPCSWVERFRVRARESTSVFACARFRIKAYNRMDVWLRQALAERAVSQQRLRSGRRYLLRAHVGNARVLRLVAAIAIPLKCERAL